MRRIALLAAWALLTGLAPPPVTVTPPEPLLGESVRIEVELPQGGWELAGLPDLSPFGLRTPPFREAGRLVLDLVALEPGLQEIPSLPLVSGSRVLSTAPQPIRVDAGIPEGAEAAPLKGLPPAPGSFSSALLPTLAAAAALAAASLLVGLGRRRTANRLPLEELPPSQLLAEIHRRIRRLDINEPGRQELLQRAEKLRFGPWPVTGEDLADLVEDWRQLRGERR